MVRTCSQGPAVQGATVSRILFVRAPREAGRVQPIVLHGGGTSVKSTASVDTGANRVLATFGDADGNCGPAEAMWIVAHGCQYPATPR